MSINTELGGSSRPFSQGFRDLYNPLNDGTNELGALFMNLIMTY